MKKVFLALAAVAMLACMSSCEKKCSCTITFLGVETTQEMNLSEIEETYNVTIDKCADMNSNIAGVGQVSCTPAL